MFSTQIFEWKKNLTVSPLDVGRLLDRLWELVWKYHKVLRHLGVLHLYENICWS